MARIQEITLLTKQTEVNGALSLLCPYTAETAAASAWLESVLAGLTSAHRAGNFKLLLSANGSEFITVDKSMIRTITVTLDAAHQFAFDGGEHLPVVGELVAVNGAETTEYAYVKSFTVTSGTWASDAAGVFEVHKATNAFAANLEDNDIIEDSGGTTICDVVGSIAR
ncbi:hypothetical protein LCGC14_1255270 [marine sediment metagenome]|uniref:Uncharacterized protein n=1 Tax=marine sediment metagenome TaxID=412755 RepID=A0A0F9NJ03_9ZZZZ